MNEQKFIMLQLKLLKENGRGAVVVPRNNFTDNRRNIRFKEEFLKYTTPFRFIFIPRNTFKSNADVHCSIMFYVKTPYKNTPAVVEDEN
jgi:tRNA splicing ligase